MEAEQVSHRKNREAEESHTRKHVWDWEDDAKVEDDMGTTILGDVMQPSPKQSPWPMALALASLLGLGAITMIGLPAAVIAGYLLSGSGDVDDETISLGLGKIEDYLSSQATQQE